MHTALYGSVPAKEVSPEMTDEAWLKDSSILRCEHEMTHDATRRILGSTRMNINDEFIADFMGFTKALGFFSASVFLEAMGITESDCKADARFWHYTTELPKEDRKEVLRITRLAAPKKEAFSKTIPDGVHRVSIFLALSEFDVVAMTKEDFVQKASEALAHWDKKIKKS